MEDINGQDLPGEAAAKRYLPDVMWLLNPRTGLVHKVTHKDTMRRCLSEGHLPVPDPTSGQPSPYAAPAPEEIRDEDAANVKAARDHFSTRAPGKGRR